MVKTLCLLLTTFGGCSSTKRKGRKGSLVKLFPSPVLIPDGLLPLGRCRALQQTQKRHRKGHLLAVDLSGTSGRNSRRVATVAECRVKDETLRCGSLVVSCLLLKNLRDTATESRKTETRSRSKGPESSRNVSQRRSANGSLSLGGLVWVFHASCQDFLKLLNTCKTGN